MSIIQRSALHLLCVLGVVSGLFVLVIPGSPAIVNAQPGIMKWDTISTPNSRPSKNDVLNPYIDGNPTGSEIRDLSIGSNGTTLIAAITVDNRTINDIPGPPLGILLGSTNAGISWSNTAYLHLISTGGWIAGNHVYNVLISPDDPKLWAITSGTVATGPTELWVTSDAGASWSNTNAPAL